MKSLQMTTQNHKFKLTLLGLVLQGMGLMAHASCGTQTGTDYVIDTDTTTHCTLPTAATSITVNTNKTLSESDTVIPQSSPILFDNPTNLTRLVNNGTITVVSTDPRPSQQAAIYLGWSNPNGSTTSIGLLENNSNGLISSNTYAIVNDSYGTIVKLDNYGTIRGNYYGALTNFGQVTEINNYGTLSQTASNTTQGGVLTNFGGTYGTITNKSSGVITGVLGGILNDYSGAIQTINNLGSIIASNGFGIVNNSGTVGTLENAQGAGNTNGALTYTGVLPTRYNIIITSTSSYGKLAVTSGTGNTTFGISSLSTRGNGILGSYSSIITGLTSTQLGVTGTSLTGTSNGYGFTLAQGSSATTWDLTIGSAPAPLRSRAGAAGAHAAKP